LSLRIGLHSGQVTAGVLRGDKSRFQLFGDTMNTAARIESNGECNRIHLSLDTATLLMDAGKQHWLEEREEKINAKGKGELQTYWLSMRLQSSPSRGSADESSSGGCEALQQMPQADSLIDEKTQRLVDWNSDIIARLMKQIIARRQASKTLKPSNFPEANASQPIRSEKKGSVLDEVLEIIHLPEFDPNIARQQVDPDTINLGDDLTRQIREYVSSVASLCRDNPFHNFEHASHVTMSVVKLLSRIVAPDDVLDQEDANANLSKDATGHIASSLHDHTYGITSDPLTQLACVFAVRT